MYVRMSRWQKSGKSVEGLPIRGAAQWSRDAAVACRCCCNRDNAAATELMLRAARVRPRGAAASLLEVLQQHLEEGRDKS